MAHVVVEARARILHLSFGQVAALPRTPVVDALIAKGKLREIEQAPEAEASAETPSEGAGEDSEQSGSTPADDDASDEEKPKPRRRRTPRPSSSDGDTGGDEGSDTDEG